MTKERPLDLTLPRLAANYRNRTCKPTEVVKAIVAAAHTHEDNPIWIHRIDEADLWALQLFLVRLLRRRSSSQ